MSAMDLVYNLLVALHLLGMAAVVGGWIAVRSGRTVIAPIVWGARAQLVTVLVAALWWPGLRTRRVAEMRWSAGVLAGLLIGLVWLTVGLVLVVVGRRRARASRAEGAGNMAVIGWFLLAVGGLTWFATLLLAVVPGGA